MLAVFVMTTLPHKLKNEEKYSGRREQDEKLGVRDLGSWREEKLVFIIAGRRILVGRVKCRWAPPHTEGS